MLTAGRKKGDGLSGTTVLQMHRIIHRALEMAAKWQLLPRNLAGAVEAPKKAGKEIKVLNEKQTALMLREASKTPYYPQLLLAVLTGMRRGEIYGLRWEDIDFEKGTISIRQAAQYLPGEVVKQKEKPKTQKS